MPFSLIPFLLLFIPILEIAIFILIGGQIGVALTLVMILVTAIVGTILLRMQGISILGRIQAETQQGNLPGKDLVDGVMIMIAGVLLLTPGFLTDGIGFLLFFPPFRSFLWSWLGSKITVTTFGTGRPAGFEHPQKRPPREGVVDLDADEYSENVNPDTPWGEKNNRISD